MDAFEAAEQMLDEIQEHYEYCDYEKILSVVDRIQEVTKDCHVPIGENYFRANLNAVREGVEDLTGPPDKKIWTSLRAREYVFDHLFRTRYGLGMMKQNFVPA
jgi:hypothetical protein